VHTFGIGNGADRELIRGSAHAGKGQAFFVSDNSGLEEVVVKALSCSTKPCLKNITMDWVNKDDIVH
jgi:hypothetical protein